MPTNSGFVEIFPVTMKSGDSPFIRCYLPLWANSSLLVAAPILFSSSIEKSFGYQSLM